MRTGLALAFTSLLALSGAALAQDAGSPGASGTGMTGSGSNPPGSGVPHVGDPAPGYQGRSYDNGMSEGRASAPDVDDPATGPAIRDGAPVNGPVGGPRDNNSD